MEVPTPAIRKTSTCLTLLPSRAPTCPRSAASTNSAWSWSGSAWSRNVRCWHPVPSGRPCPVLLEHPAARGKPVRWRPAFWARGPLSCDALGQNVYRTTVSQPVNPARAGHSDRETVVGRPHRRALVSWTGGMGQRCCTPSTPTTKGGNASSGDRSLVGRVPGRRGEPRPASRPGQAAAPVPDGCDSAH